ncbi:MAG: TolC family protein [Verrucomicrobiota bacterium]
MGLERGVLDRSFSVQELTMAYFQLVQHSIALAIMEPKLRRLKAPSALICGVEPRRAIELFLRGAASQRAELANGHPGKTSARLGLARRAAAATVAALALTAFTARAQTNAPAPDATNAPTATLPTGPTSPATEPAPAAGPPSVTNTAPVLEDVRPIPLAVRAGHPELATVSPIADNATNPRALDLQTCFQLTAVRDDSLKISAEDVEIARAQMSEAIAALWPTFAVSNQQQFIHFLGPNNGLSFTSFGVPIGGSTGSGSGSGTGTGTGTGGTSGGSAAAAAAGQTITATPGNRNYGSQSQVTMNYTIFNGGQNWNAVGAASHGISAKRQTLARDYQTIYQDVAQAFYNVLQFQGDMNVQGDLIDALAARVEDLRSRVGLGRSRPSELLQAQTDLANARVTLESQRGSLNTAKVTLGYYIGLPPELISLKDTQAFPTAKELDLYLMHSPSRPDVLSQVESMKQAERNLSVAEGQLWPTISAEGNYLAQQDPVSNNIDATMTLQISMPIFDGGLIISQIHQNKETVRQSRINVEQLQRNANEDVRNAYANFDAAVAQVIVLREAATLAARDFEAQVDDYRRGVVSNLDVLTALQDYQTARIQLHNANMTARLDLINLHVAAGTAARGPGADNQALPLSSGTAR